MGNGWLLGFYGVSTLEDLLMSNSFLNKYSVVFQTTQFSMSKQFNSQKHFHFSLLSLVKLF